MKKRGKNPQLNDHDPDPDLDHQSSNQTTIHMTDEDFSPKTRAFKRSSSIIEIEKIQAKSVREISQPIDKNDLPTKYQRQFNYAAERCEIYPEIQEEIGEYLIETVAHQEQKLKYQNDRKELSDLIDEILSINNYKVKKGMYDNSTKEQRLTNLRKLFENFEDRIEESSQQSELKFNKNVNKLNNKLKLIQSENERLLDDLDLKEVELEELHKELEKIKNLYYENQDLADQLKASQTNEDRSKKKLEVSKKKYRETIQKLTADKLAQTQENSRLILELNKAHQMSTRVIENNSNEKDKEIEKLKEQTGELEASLNKSKLELQNKKKELENKETENLTLQEEQTANNKVYVENVEEQQGVIDKLNEEITKLTDQKNANPKETSPTSSVSEIDEFRETCHNLQDQLSRQSQRHDSILQNKSNMNIRTSSQTGSPGSFDNIATKGFKDDCSGRSILEAQNFNRLSTVQEQNNTNGSCEKIQKSNLQFQSEKLDRQVNGKVDISVQTILTILDNPDEATGDFQKLKYKYDNVCKQTEELKDEYRDLEKEYHQKVQYYNERIKDQNYLTMTPCNGFDNEINTNNNKSLPEKEKELELSEKQIEALTMMEISDIEKKRRDRIAEKGNLLKELLDVSIVCEAFSVDENNSPMHTVDQIVSFDDISPMNVNSFDKVWKKSNFQSKVEINDSSVNVECLEDMGASEITKVINRYKDKVNSLSRNLKKLQIANQEKDESISGLKNQMTDFEENREEIDKKLLNNALVINELNENLASQQLKYSKLRKLAEYAAKKDTKLAESIKELNSRRSIMNINIPGTFQRMSQFGLVEIETEKPPKSMKACQQPSSKKCITQIHSPAITPPRSSIRSIECIETMEQFKTSNRIVEMENMRLPRNLSRSHFDLENIPSRSVDLKAESSIKSFRHSLDSRQSLKQRKSVDSRQSLKQRESIDLRNSIKENPSYQQPLYQETPQDIPSTRKISLMKGLQFLEDIEKEKEDFQIEELKKKAIKAAEEDIIRKANIDQLDKTTDTFGLKPKTMSKKTETVELEKENRSEIESQQLPDIYEKVRQDIREKTEIELREKIKDDIRPELEDEMRPAIEEKLIPGLERMLQPKIREELTPILKLELEPELRLELVPKIEKELRPRIEIELRPIVEEEIRSMLERQLRPKIREEMKPQIEAQLRPIIEQELRPDIEEELRQILPKELRPDIEKELRQILHKELRPDIEKELRPDIEKELRQILPNELRPDIVKEVTPQIVEDVSPKLKSKMKPEIELELKPILTEQLEKKYEDLRKQDNEERQLKKKLKKEEQLKKEKDNQLEKQRRDEEDEAVRDGDLKKLQKKQYKILQMGAELNKQDGYEGKKKKMLDLEQKLQGEIMQLEDAKKTHEEEKRAKDAELKKENQDRRHFEMAYKLEKDKSKKLKLKSAELERRRKKEEADIKKKDDHQKKELEAKKELENVLNIEKLAGKKLQKQLETQDKDQKEINEQLIGNYEKQLEEEKEKAKNLTVELSEAERLREEQVRLKIETEELLKKEEGALKEAYEKEIEEEKAKAIDLTGKLSEAERLGLLEAERLGKEQEKLKIEKEELLKKEEEARIEKEQALEKEAKIRKKYEDQLIKAKDKMKKQKNEITDMEKTAEANVGKHKQEREQEQKQRKIDEENIAKENMAKEKQLRKKYEVQLVKEQDEAKKLKLKVGEMDRREKAKEDKQKQEKLARKKLEEGYKKEQEDIGKRQADLAKELANKEDEAKKLLQKVEEMDRREKTKEDKLKQEKLARKKLEKDYKKGQEEVEKRQADLAEELANKENEAGKLKALFEDREKEEVEKRQNDLANNENEANKLKALLEDKEKEAEAKADKLKALYEDKEKEAEAQADQLKALLEDKDKEAKAEADKLKALQDDKEKEAKAEAERKKLKKEKKVEEKKKNEAISTKEKDNYLKIANELSKMKDQVKEANKEADKLKKKEEQLKKKKLI